METIIPVMPARSKLGAKAVCPSAEMIAHNHKVQDRKRAEKAEIARWFAVWLETPSAFFDWLEVRRQSAEFQEKFPAGGPEDG